MEDIFQVSKLVYFLGDFVKYKLLVIMNKNVQCLKDVVRDACRIEFIVLYEQF